MKHAGKIDGALSILKVFALSLSTLRRTNAMRYVNPRTLEAAKLGAKIVSIAPGYLSVVQARARQYCAQTGARLMPFGADMPEAINAIAAAACATEIEPDDRPQSASDLLDSTRWSAHTGKTHCCGVHCFLCIW